MKEIGIQRLKESFAIEAECLKDALAYIDEASFAKAVDLLATAERIGTSGCGRLAPNG